jgi:hypothetical protein
MNSGEWNPPADEVEYREVAWEVISRLSVARLLEDCVEALVEAYQIDRDLYLTDKEMLVEEDTMSTVVEKEQEEQDDTVTE